MKDRKTFYIVVRMSLATMFFKKKVMEIFLFAGLAEGLSIIYLHIINN